MVSDKNKPYKHRRRLEATKILDLERYCTICVAKTKTLISCAFTAELICIFVFAYAKCLFSGAAPHL